MISRKLRTQIFGRDNNQCVSCGSQQDLTIQHRVNRGMGGSKLVETPAHLITLCLSCNNFLESDSAFAREGRRKGYKLPRNSSPPADPTIYPVWYAPEKTWYLLDNELNKREI